MKKIIIFTCLFWLHSVFLYAEQSDTTLVKTDTLPKYGTLKVEVLDSEINEPLPGAKIILQEMCNTSYTDIEGQCTINNIVPGKYKLFTRMLGYKSKSKKIYITDTCTIKVTIKLKATPLEGVVIVDYPSMVQPDKTSSVHVYTAEEIKRYPSKP